MKYVVKVLRYDGARYSDGYFEQIIEADTWESVGHLITFYKGIKVVGIFSAHTLHSILPRS